MSIEVKLDDIEHCSSHKIVTIIKIGSQKISIKLEPFCGNFHKSLKYTHLVGTDHL